MSVPQKVKKILMDTYGEVFLSNNELSKLTKAKRLAYLRLVFDYVTLYLNVHYPLRLVRLTVHLRPVDVGNYLQGTKLHLNNFKNVRLIGAQVIDSDGSTVNLIAQFLHFLINSLGQTPTKLLWRFYNNSPGEYDTNNGFSSTLSKLFVKYNGKPMSMNMIRHIVESHLIQSPTYAKLNNREKHDLHAKLLHSQFAANTSYNKIANRSTASEVNEEAPDFSYEPAPQPPSPAKPQTRSKTHYAVSHAFVDLWHLIEDEKSFDKHVFSLLDEPEQDFMRYCFIKCHIKSREFDSVYNEELDGVVKRLKMLQGATAIGDDNPDIKKEMKQLLDKLYEKGVFSTNYYTQFKRLMKLS
ncbi:hypothetical protein PPTG_10704 [Phytophthora nicotianae INRA-310]|uniref:Uncharacterized protein n=2 Tax=Phytophthora nicotianae TaxID=4792 RepID=W2QCJ4_PHYN3|nr:hypothetical protein PPTG_10704 [Phytophthora nicotianae INRA-310]ETN10596.1 hypothetical protein PPTG_10704 [Phytophthora nicotianae INRA-310]